MFAIRNVLILAALLTVGCAANPDAKPAATPAGMRENGLLALTGADNNRSAEIRVGEQIQLRLPESPNTGFRWAIDETNSRLLTLDHTEFTGPTEGFVGAKGQRTFVFTARQAGEVALKLKYWRFLEGDASATERYAITLQIRE